MSDKRKIIIDTDTGVDDALAILLALRSPELEIIGITTVAGNVEVEHCSQNVAAILDQLQAPNIPIIQGAVGPMTRPLLTAPEVHGPDGLGDIRKTLPASDRAIGEDAVGFILDAVKQYGNELTIVAIGPLTNIALAIRENPLAMRQIGQIISMGGAVSTYGNTTTVGEFNYCVDPEAAAIVFESAVPAIMLPLDVTEQALLTREQVEEWQASFPSAIANFIANATEFYMNYHEETEGFNGGFMHDPLAIALAISPEIFTLQEANIYIETRGEWTSGMSVVDLRQRFLPIEPVPTRVVSTVDTDAFLQMFRSRLWEF